MPKGVDIGIKDSTIVGFDTGIPASTIACWTAVARLLCQILDKTNPGIIKKHTKNHKMSSIVYCKLMCLHCIGIAGTVYRNFYTVGSNAVDNAHNAFLFFPFV